MSMYPGRVTGLFVLIAAGISAGCATQPPRNPHDLCQVFSEKRAWYKAARKSQQRWQTPIALQMAIIYQESRFKATARPPRKRFLGFIPTTRKSSAFGYAQATDSTWRWYQQQTGRRGADRDDFGDAVDFVGWYASMSRQKLGLSWNDARHHYLAYHEGHTGYLRRSYRRKPRLQRIADEVARRTKQYHHQLRHCRKRLERPWWWPG